MQARYRRGEHDRMCYVRIGMNNMGTGREHKQPNEGLQVRVGHDQLVGEVIRIEADRATVQVYEETGMDDHPCRDCA